MSTNFTIISKESDFQQLLSKLKDKGIKLQLPSSDTSYSSDNNHSFKNQINDSDEYIDFCIFKTFSLLLDSIRSNNELSNDLKSSSIIFLRELIFNKKFREHLVISVLYTTRYLTSNSYMRINLYVYYQAYGNNKKCFWDKDHINDFTTMKDKKKNSLIIRNPNKKLKMNKKGPEKSYKDGIDGFAEQVPNSLYRNLFDLEPSTGSKASFIRLFLPTYALISNHYMEIRDKKTEMKEKEKENNEEASEKSTHSKRPPLPNLQIDIPDELQDISIKLDDKLVSELDEKIRTTLDCFELEYSNMANFIKNDPFYTSSEANKCLYFYRLNLAFPMQFLLSIFNPKLQPHFILDYIKAVIKIPDNYTRCIFYQYIAFFSGDLQLINDVIDIIFPTIEEICFAYAAIRYNFDYQLLDNDLTKYVNKHISSDHIFNASMIKDDFDKRSIDCIPEYYSFDSDDTPLLSLKWKFFTSGDTTQIYRHPLYALYLFNKHTYNYDDNLFDEIIHQKYEYLSGYRSEDSFYNSILEAKSRIVSEDKISSENEFTILTAKIINLLLQ